MSDTISAADQTIDLSGLINNHILQIDRLKAEVGEVKEMLDAIFANDPTYQTHDTAVKEAVKVRGQTKKQILKLPQALDLANRIADKKSHLKELTADLSGYLQDYSRSTGATTFETEDGQLREIIYVAKLVKKIN
jgi:hypothetical protein